MDQLNEHSYPSALLIHDDSDIQNMNLMRLTKAFADASLHPLSYIFFSVWRRSDDDVSDGERRRLATATAAAAALAGAAFDEKTYCCRMKCDAIFSALKAGSFHFSLSYEKFCIDAAFTSRR